MPALVSDALKSAAVDEDSLTDTIRLEVPGRSTAYGICKFAVEWATACLLLVLLAPFLAILALIVKCTSRGPAIYAQTRLGKDDRPFTLYKFRTMRHDCERLSGPCWAQPDDPRVTVLGRFLRAFHLDELPQLWNVVRGEMSLIGPRPERPEIIAKLETVIPRYSERRQVRPGMTGLAQVQLPPDTTLSCVRRKLIYDLYYIEQISFWLDLQILSSTFCKFLGIPLVVLPPIFILPARERLQACA